MVLIGSTGEPTVNPGLVTPEGIDLSNEYTILLGKRGSPKRRSASVRQTVFAPLGKHSEKPLVFRSEIEKLMEGRRRIELFCRHNATAEWDAWGNQVGAHDAGVIKKRKIAPARSEEHTSELQSLMRISYAVFCLKTKTKDRIINTK